MAGIVRGGVWYSGVQTPATASALGLVKPDGTTTSVDANGVITASASAEVDASGRNTYGTCSTAAGTAAKVISITNTHWSLQVGAEVTVKFSNTNTASNPTLNVGGTGAYPVWYNTAVISTASLGFAGTANRPIKYVFDGTYWVFVGWSVDSNTTYSNASLGQGYAVCNSAAATSPKVASITGYSKTTGGIVCIKFKNAVGASAQLNITGKGAAPIFFNGDAITAGVIQAGDTATFMFDGTNYNLLATDTLISRLAAVESALARTLIVESGNTI